MEHKPIRTMRHCPDCNSQVYTFAGAYCIDCVVCDDELTEPSCVELMEDWAFDRALREAMAAHDISKLEGK